MPCEIKITSCANLKEVVFSGFELRGVTERHIQDLIFRLPYLEKLYLGGLCFIRRINISSPRLKIFEICSCSILVKVENLRSMLQTWFISSFMEVTQHLLESSSSHLEVGLSLYPYHLSAPLFVDLIEFFQEL